MGATPKGGSIIPKVPSGKEETKLDTSDKSAYMKDLFAKNRAQIERVAGMVAGFGGTTKAPSGKLVSLAARRDQALAAEKASLHTMGNQLNQVYQMLAKKEAVAREQLWALSSKDPKVGKEVYSLVTSGKFPQEMDVSLALRLGGKENFYKTQQVAKELGQVQAEMKKLNSVFESRSRRLAELQRLLSKNKDFY